MRTRQVAKVICLFIYLLIDISLALANTQPEPSNPAFQIPFVESKNALTNTPSFSAPVIGGGVQVRSDGVHYSVRLQNSNDRAKTAIDVVLSLIDTEDRPILLDPRGSSPASTTVSLFRGASKSGWQTNLKSFWKVDLGRPWPGIAVRLQATSDNAEQFFVVAPGADHKVIRMRVNCDCNLQISDSGELVIPTKNGRISFTAPVAYQIVDDARALRRISYRLISSNVYGFELGAYDQSLPIVIDPVLSSTYVGGTGEERYVFDEAGGHVYVGHPSSARSPLGKIYIVGSSRSPNFPTTAGAYDTSYNDQGSILENDVVIFRLSADFSQLEAATYLGGDSEDDGASIALDSNGKVFVTGQTLSSNFPALSAYDTTYNGGASDAFVARLSTDLTTLEAASFLGGSSTDVGYSILVLPLGDIIIGGDTSSANFPANIRDTTLGGSFDGFLAKMTNSLGSLTSASYVGGSSFDYLRAVRLSADALSLYVTGYTQSTDLFSLSGVYDNSQNLGQDAYILKISLDLGTLSKGTYLGGSGDDRGYALSVLSTGAVVMGGVSISTNYPTSAGAFRTARTGTSYDTVISLLPADLSALTASTYYGGSQTEELFDIAADSASNIYIVGGTNSSDIPSAVDSFSRVLKGTTDGFVARFNSSLNAASFYNAAYFGGGGQLDTIHSVILDGSENLILYGLSNSSDFPTVSGAYATTNRGARDMFISRMTNDLRLDYPAHHLVVSTNLDEQSKTLNAGGTVSVKISVRDSLNRVVSTYNDAIAGDDLSVTLQGASTSLYGFVPYCKNKSNSNVTFNLPILLNFKNGYASTTCTFYTLENAHINASISSLNLTSLSDQSWDLDLNVQAGGMDPSGTLISAMPSPATVNNQVSITVIASDQFGNPVGSAGGAGHLVLITIAGVHSRLLYPLDNGDGTYSVSYTTESSGFDTIRGTINLANIGSDTDGTRDGTFNLQINDLGMHHFTLRYETPPNGSKLFEDVGSVTAGNGIRVVIRASDILGNPVISYNGNAYASLLFSGLNNSLYGSVPQNTGTDDTGARQNLGTSTALRFVFGYATTTIYPYESGEFVLDARDASNIFNSYSDPSYDLHLTVNPSSVTHLTVNGTKASQLAGEPQTLTVRARDAYGNTNKFYIYDHAITFTGPGTSYNGNVPFVVDRDANLVPFGTAASLWFNAGIAVTTGTLYRRQVLSIDASDGASSTAGSASYDWDVNVSSTGAIDYSKTDISSDANPAGNCGFVAARVTARDLYGNQLEHGGAAVVFNITGANAHPNVTASDRADGVYLYLYPPTNSGTDLYTATVNGNPLTADIDYQYLGGGYFSDGTYSQLIDANTLSQTTWMGELDSNWFNADNWSGHVVPESCFEVLVDGNYTFAPLINHSLGPVNLHDLTVGPNNTSELTTSNASPANKIVLSGDLHIGPKGTLKHASNTTTSAHRLIAQVGGDVTLDSGGLIDLDSLGYTGGSGPGAGGPLTGGVYAAGAGHGGIGGVGNGATVAGVVYGSVAYPQTIGSGGGGAIGIGGAGGGSLELVATGQVAINGIIRARGGDAGGSWYGGGAGGSIYVDAGVISGDGTVLVDGGMSSSAGVSVGGGGAGGRVALVYNTLAGFSLSRITAFGGKSSREYGGAGTVFSRDKLLGQNSLVISNNDYATAALTSIAGETLSLHSLTMTHQAKVRLDSGSNINYLGPGLATSSNSFLNVTAGTTFSANNLLTLSNFVLTNSGTVSFNSLSTISGVTLTNNTLLNLPAIALIESSNITNNGQYNHSSHLFTLEAGSTWVENGTVSNFGTITPITTIVVQGATLEFANQSIVQGAAYDSITIRSGGVLTHTANSSSEQYALNLSVVDLNVEAGGKIDLLGKGYAALQGLGAGVSFVQDACGNYRVGGGGHGGEGGITASPCPRTGGGVYGSVFHPTSLGSRGGAWSTYDGASQGGGVILLSVSGTFNVDGTIDTSGIQGLGSDGGGSGGTINVSTNKLRGSGYLSSSGGFGTMSSGGGGRIALYYTQNQSFDLLHLQAFGGNSSSQYGAAGTVFMKSPADPYGVLVVDNNNYTSNAVTWLPPSSPNYTFDRVVIRNKGVLGVASGVTLNLASSSMSDTIDAQTPGCQLVNNGTVSWPSSTVTLNGSSNLIFINNGDITPVKYLTVEDLTFVQNGIFSNVLSTITVDSGGILEYRRTTQSVVETYDSLHIKAGGILTHTANDLTQQYIINLALTDFILDAGAVVALDGRGYGISEGPGQGTNHSFESGGGGHGGIGGYGLYGGLYYLGGLGYGSVIDPNTIGSGGGLGSNGFGGRGGGAIVLAVSDTTTLNGVVNVFGLGVIPVTYAGGGGAGGTINITTNHLQGGGVLNAKGGTVSTGGTLAGGGAGGRVALKYATGSLNDLTISAYGGTGRQAGGAGTIYTKAANELYGTVFLDNNSQSGARTELPNLAEHFGNVDVSDGANWQLQAEALWMAESVDLRFGGNTTFLNFSADDHVYIPSFHVYSGGVVTSENNSNVFMHRVSLRSDYLTVDAGGRIDVSGKGYAPGYGALGGIGSGTSGGGYGGSGGLGNAGAPGISYGSQNNPKDIGSGAALGGGAGGGGMRLQVYHDFVLHGDLLATGADGPANSTAGGAGGSIIVTAAEFRGTGYIGANGGLGKVNGGGGGGGRIAGFFFHQTFETDGGRITSSTPGQFSNPRGGAGFQAGSEGTLYLAFPDHYEVTGNNLQVAGQSQTVTISFIDNHGNPFLYSGPRSIVFSGPANALDGTKPTCTNMFGEDIAIGGVTLIDLVDGLATCSLKLYRVENTSLDVADGSFSSLANELWDLDIGVSAPNVPYAADSILSASPNIVEVNNPVTVTVVLWQRYGIPMTLGGNNVQIFVGGANTRIPSVVDHGDGTYTAVYTPTSLGTDLITASVQGQPLAKDTDGVSDGTYHVLVTGGQTHHLEVRGASLQEAGTSQIINIAAKDINGYTNLLYSGVKWINITGANVSPFGNYPSCRDRFGGTIRFGQNASLEFVNGQASCTMYLYKVESAHINASDGVYSSFGDQTFGQDVTVISPSDLDSYDGVISAQPNPVERLFPVTIDVQTTDIYGNTRPAGGLPVQIQVAGANILSPVVTDLANGTYRATYSPSNAGIDLITGNIGASALSEDTDGVSDGTYHEYVTDTVVPTHLEVTGFDTQIAGTSQIISIWARDDLGKRAFSYSGAYSMIISGPQSSTDGHHPTCRDRLGNDIDLGQPTVLEFTNGLASCVLYLYRSEVTSVDADDGSLNSFGNPLFDLDLTVLGSGLNTANATISAFPSEGKVGQLQAVKVSTWDEYGNQGLPGKVVLISVGGANPSSAVATDNRDGTYSLSYTPTTAGFDLITATVDGASLVHDQDGTDDGVYHLPIRAVLAATHFEITGLNTQVAGSLQEVTILARDDFGVDVAAYTGRHALIFSGPSISLAGNPPTASDYDGIERAFGTPISVDFVSGLAQAKIRLYRAEVTQVDITDGIIDTLGSPDYDLDVHVIAGPTLAQKSILGATPRPANAGDMIGVSVQTYDWYDNAANNSDVVSTLVSGSNSGFFDLVYDTDGIYRGSYLAQNGGTDLITGTVNGIPLAHDSDGISEGTFEEPILIRQLVDHFEIRGMPRQHSGDSQVITISAKDEFGSVVEGYSGQKFVRINGASASPDGRMPVCRDKNDSMQVFGKEMSLNFVDGVATCELVLFNIEISELDISDGNISSAGNPNWDLDVEVFGADIPGINGYIDAAPNPVTLGNQATVTVTSYDVHHARVLTGGGVVTLAVNGVSASSASIVDNHNGYYTLTYMPQAVGVDVITGTIDGNTIIQDGDGTSDGVYHLFIIEEHANLYQIRGTARWSDQKQTPAQGVTVTDGARSAITNSNGAYVLQGVPPGSYQLAGSLIGYRVEPVAGVNPVVITDRSVSDRDFVVTRGLPNVVYAPWNGFLNNVVIIEVFNTGDEVLDTDASLYIIEGKLGGRVHYRIPPGEQRDIIVNDMPGFQTDLYGILKIEFGHARYNGQVSYYKLSPSGQFRLIPAVADDFDYAFSNPFVSPMTGASYVGFNTFQPSYDPEESRNLVPNWLTIINGNPTKKKYFRIRKYDISGNRIAIPDTLGAMKERCKAISNSLRCWVPPLGRADIDGGHVYPGPGNVGLVEIIPEDLTSPYTANLVRYGMSAPPEQFTGRYSFGTYLQARTGTEREQVLPVSTASNADNWIELANVSSRITTATVTVYDYSGKLIKTSKVKIKPMSQTHLDVGTILGKNMGNGTSGVAKISGSVPDALLATNIFYYRDFKGRVASVLASQAQEPLNTEIYGSYNTYFDAQNWLKLINLLPGKRKVTLEVHLPLKQVSTFELTLQPNGGVDLPLHDETRYGISVNSLGMIAIRDSVAGGIHAELFRIKPEPDNSFDFIMNAKVR